MANVDVCNNSFELEPRLKAYLKKRIYNKQNSKSCVSLEREYWITDEDKKTLGEYLKKKKNIQQTKPEISQIRDCPNSLFPSTAQRLFDDPRIPKIKKQQMDKKIVNRGMFAGENFYEEQPNSNFDILMDVRDVNKKHSEMMNSKRDIQRDIGKNLNNSRFDPRIDPLINRGKVDFNKYESHYRIDTNGDGGERYGCFASPILGGESEMDTKNRVVIPNVATRGGKLLSTSNYVFTDFRKDGVNITQLVDGMPTRTKKTYGYRDTDHFNYDFIDPEFQNAENSVEPWARGGEGTRILNKNIISH